MGRSRIMLGASLASLVGLIAAAASVWAGAAGSDGIRWHDDIYAAHQYAVSTNKPMLIVISSDWCGHCNKLWKQTLSDRRLETQVQQHFVPVHLDFDQHKTVARTLEVTSIPATIVLSPRADLLGRIVGYIEPDRFGVALDKARGLGQRLEAAEIAP